MHLAHTFIICLIAGLIISIPLTLWTDMRKLKNGVQPEAEPILHAQAERWRSKRHPGLRPQPSRWTNREGWLFMWDYRMLYVAIEKSIEIVYLAILILLLRITEEGRASILMIAMGFIPVAAFNFNGECRCLKQSISDLLASNIAGLRPSKKDR